MATLPLAIPAAAQEDGRALEVWIDNTGEATRVQVRVADASTGAVVYDREMDVAARAQTRVSVPVRPALYDVEVSTTTLVTLGASARVDMVGCDALGRAAFTVWSDGLGGDVSRNEADAGCATLTSGALALLAEARAASSASAARIRVPLPGDADAGAYAGWPRVGEPDWPNGTRTEFAWQDEAPMVDEWGREVPATRVVVDRHTPVACSTLVRAVAQTSEGGTASDAPGWVAFARGEVEPLASLAPACEAVIHAGADGVRDRSTTLQVVRYRTSDVLGCLLRHSLQGATLAPGDSVTIACDRWPTSAWKAAAPREERGLLAIPLYATREDATGTFVARMLVADGVAYPLELRTFELPAGGLLRATAYRLEALDAAGEPIATDPLGLDPPKPPLAPVDPLRGPADGATPFPLAHAVDAALADPTLVDLRAMSGRAHLAAAMMRARSEPGAPQPASHLWHLVFADDAGATANATCERPQAPLALVPVARCSAGVPDDAARLLGTPPDGHARASVPAAGASFAEAAARWAVLDPDAASRGVGFAMYRAWAPAILAIGEGRTAAIFPTDAAGSLPMSYAQLALADGSTLALVQGREELAPLGRVADGIEAASGASAPAPAPPGAGLAAAALVGGGVALLLLLGALAYWLLHGWIAALFTRLLRPKILDAELRASIHDLVLARPGVHASEIIQHFDRGTGNIEYHLDVLVREGFLTSLRTSGYRHYFVTGRFSPAEMRALAALRAGQGERLYRIIEANPGIHVQALAEQAGLSVGYVSKEVKRMNEAGLVDQVKVGRAVRLHALDR